MALVITTVPATTAPRPARDAFLPSFARSFYPGRSGQVMVVPREGHFITGDDDVSRHLESLPFVFAAYTEDEVRRAARR